MVGLATQDPVLKNLELHLWFHETNCERKLHLKLHELTTDQTESAVEMKKNETSCEGDELCRENRPHKKTNSGGRADLTSRIEASQMIKTHLDTKMQEISEENRHHCETNCGGRADLTSRMEASRMIKNLLAGEMQDEISKENTKTPKHEKCGHCDLWLITEDVWTTTSDVRRQTNSYGGLPVRTLVMAHQRKRCHRSQESARIGLARGRGTQDIQSPGQSRQQNAHKGCHGDWNLSCNKCGIKGQIAKVCKLKNTRNNVVEDVEDPEGKTHVGNYTNFVLIDRIGSWPSICQSREGGTDDLTLFLSKYPKKFDVPENITSEGPEFASSKVQNFVKSWNVEQRTSSECYPSALTIVTVLTRLL